MVPIEPLPPVTPSTCQTTVVPAVVLAVNCWHCVRVTAAFLGVKVPVAPPLELELELPLEPQAATEPLELLELEPLELELLELELLELELEAPELLLEEELLELVPLLEPDMLFELELPPPPQATRYVVSAATLSVRSRFKRERIIGRTCPVLIGVPNNLVVSATPRKRHARCMTVPGVRAAVKLIVRRLSTNLSG